MGKMLIFLPCTLLTACAHHAYPVSSPYYQIPAESQLILKQPVAITPNKGRVYIQYGKIVTSMKPDKYFPHCWFVAWTISSIETVIKPDKFSVIKSKTYENYVDRQNSLMFASRAHPLGVSDSLMAIESFTELTIHSEAQANIRQFICNQWNNPTDAQHLTVAEINQTLGDIAELKPATK